MTPKEKATELTDRFRDIIISFLSDNMKQENAKKCALIAVDEICKTNLKYGAYLETDWDKTYYYSYWEDVKKEIENMKGGEQ